MNIGKSINKALAEDEKNTVWLANKLKRSTATISLYRRSVHCQTETAQKLAKAFGMKTSEFIALGE